MGKAMTKLFGGSSSKQESKPVEMRAYPFTFQTGAGNISATPGTYATWDEKRGIQKTPGSPTQVSVDMDRGYSTRYGQSGSVLGSLLPTYQGVSDEGVNLIRGDIQRFRDNENPFVQARVTPLKQEYARQYGELQRGLGRRNVFGSIGANELMRFSNQANREIADQGALATQEATAASLQATNDLLSAAKSRADVENVVAEQWRTLGDAELTAVLKEMGLGMAAIELLVQDRRLSTQSEQKTDDSGKGILNTIGRGLFAFGA